MNTPLMPAQSTAVSQLQFYGDEKGESASAAPAKFDRWTISLSAIDSFLQGKGPEEVEKIAERMYSRAELQQDTKSFKLGKLKKDFGDFDLPVDFSQGRSQELKVRIITGLILGLQTEANSGSADRPLGHGFCGLMKKSESSIAEGVQQLLDEINGDFDPELTTGTKKVISDAQYLAQASDLAKAQMQARILDENPALDEAQARSIVEAQCKALDEAQDLVRTLEKAQIQALDQSRCVSQSLARVLALCATQNVPLQVGAEYLSLAQVLETEAKDLAQGLNEVLDEAQELGLTLDRAKAQSLPRTLAQIQVQAQDQAQALAQILDEDPVLAQAEALAQVIGQAQALAEALAKSPGIVGAPGDSN